MGCETRSDSCVHCRSDHAANMVPAPNSSAFTRLRPGWEGGCWHCFEPGQSLLLRPQSCSSSGALLPPLLLAVTAEQLFGWESTCVCTLVWLSCAQAVFMVFKALGWQCLFQQADLESYVLFQNHMQLAVVEQDISKQARRWLPVG